MGDFGGGVNADFGFRPPGYRMQWSNLSLGEVIEQHLFNYRARLPDREIQPLALRASAAGPGAESGSGGKSTANGVIPAGGETTHEGSGVGPAVGNTGGGAYVAEGNPPTNHSIAGGGGGEISSASPYKEKTQIAPGIAADGAPPRLDADILREMTEDHWIEVIDELVGHFGLEAVQKYEAPGKHKHRLIHMAVCKELPQVIYHLVRRLDVDVNVRRLSDLCTPMHLAMFYKKKSVVDMLGKVLDADLSVRNAYGEACDESYAKFVASYQNIVFLDLELTHGFYEADLSNPPGIIEIAVVITDKDLNVLTLDPGLKHELAGLKPGEPARATWLVGGYNKEMLESMSEFHQRHFRDAEAGGAFPPVMKDGSGVCVGGEEEGNICIVVAATFYNVVVLADRGFCGLRDSRRSTAISACIGNHM